MLQLKLNIICFAHALKHADCFAYDFRPDAVARDYGYAFSALRH